MRAAWTALTLLALALTGAASAQDGALPAAERAFYGRVAEQSVAQAHDEDAVAWAAGGRGGSIAFQSAQFGCKSFFLTELQPERRPPVSGAVCPTGGANSTWIASNVRYAPAAGPRGEPRDADDEPSRSIGNGTRGISVPPPAPPPPPAREQPPTPSPTPGAQPTTPSLEVRGRIVQLNRLQPRIDRAGGHAVVLMTNAAALQPRNRLLCLAMKSNFQETSYSNTQVGAEKEKDGTVVRIRPIFWPVTGAAAGGGDRCTQLLRTYDFGRAAAIRDKMELRDPGPYLVVSRDDQRQAAIINMTGLTDAQIAPMVRYFRDRFSQKPDVWLPQVTTTAERRGGLIATFGTQFTENLMASVRLFQASAARIGTGCIGDATDTRACR